KGSRVPEAEVARRALDMARRARQTQAGAASEHVGYYLIGAGLPVLEADVGYRPALANRLRGLILRHPHRFYFGTLVLLMGVFLMLLGIATWAAKGNLWLV